MLISFKVKNFKSFLEEAELSMKAVSWKANLEYSTIENKGAERALCSSVIYGVNGSGKSNLLDALTFLCNIIMIGVGEYKLHCNNHDAVDGDPTVFSIKFANKGHIVDYTVKVIMAVHEQKIDHECLFVDHERIFIRDQDSVRTKDHDYTYDQKFTFIDPKNGTLNKEIKGIATNWFIGVFHPIYDLAPHQLDIKMTFMHRAGINLNKILNFIGINDIDIADASTLAGPICIARKKNVKYRLSELISPGVMKAMFLISTTLLAMKNGSTIFIDQMDDIDVHLVLQLITLFHNDDINVNHAQLIFTTHNPIYINSGIFRPDEIKFVERRGSKSSIYSLADFEDGRDLDYDYIKYVDEGRYGAVNFYDGLAEFFEEGVNIKEEES